MAGSHYELLEVARDCSHDELRRAYHRAARQHHPDKQTGAAGVDQTHDKSERNGAGTEGDDLFVRIQAAYDVLRDPKTRAEYDQEATREDLCRQRDVEDVRIAEEVFLSDMVREELTGEEADDDGDTTEEVLYSHQCRCGDAYEITEYELHDGIDIVPCNGCSLNIRVVMRTP